MTLKQFKKISREIKSACSGASSLAKGATLEASKRDGHGGAVSSAEWFIRFAAGNAVSFIKLNYDVSGNPEFCLSSKRPEGAEMLLKLFREWSKVFLEAGILKELKPVPVPGKEPNP